MPLDQSTIRSQLNAVLVWVHEPICMSMETFPTRFTRYWNIFTYRTAKIEETRFRFNCKTRSSNVPCVVLLRSGSFRPETKPERTLTPTRYMMLNQMQKEPRTLLSQHRCRVRIYSPRDKFWLCFNFHSAFLNLCMFAVCLYAAISHALQPKKTRNRVILHQPIQFAALLEGNYYSSGSG